MLDGDAVTEGAGTASLTRANAGEETTVYHSIAGTHSASSHTRIAQDAERARKKALNECAG